MDYRNKLNKIKAFAFDVDGVLSSGMIAMPDGELLRMMDARDGYIIKKSIDRGWPIAIITGGCNQSVKVRFEKIGVKDYYDANNSKSKLPCLKDFAQKHNITTDEILYAGDDIADLACLKHAGIGACPIDACQEAKEISDYISQKEGGHGFVRELMEMVLRSQNQWPILTNEE